MSTASGTPILSARGLRQEYGKLTGGTAGHIGALIGLAG